MKASDKIHIAFASDDSYSKYLGVCIASILLSAEPEEDFSFYVIDNGISDSNKARLADLQALRPHALIYLKPDLEKYRRLPQCSYWGITTYLRLVLPEELPELDRLLYLDCDMVATTSLGELWRTELHGKAMGVVEDYDGRTVGKERRASSLGLDFYFNSGMLLLDLKQLREKKLFEQVLQWILFNADRLKFPDQDGLNAVLKDDILKLPPRWNIQANPTVQLDEILDEDKRESLRENRGILHFITLLKPDRYEFSMPQREYFLEAIQRTPWRDCLEKPTLRKMWRRFKNTNWLYQKFRNLEKRIKSRLKNVK